MVIPFGMFQVMVWKTNFDQIDYNEVLQSHRVRSQSSAPPHIHDIHPRSPHHRHGARSGAQDINVNSEPKNMAAPTPNVTNLGPALFTEQKVSSTVCHRLHSKIYKEIKESMTQNTIKGIILHFYSCVDIIGNYSK